jgi:hypothetical protein
MKYAKRCLVITTRRKKAMVVRINYRQSFARTVGYAFKSAKRPEIVAGNMSLSEPDGIIREFTSVAEKNTRCKNPVAHLAFSLAEGETLKQTEWDWFCREVADNYGFQQFVAVRHNDTACEHIHFIGNRIQLNGKATSTSNDRYRMRELCHTAEERFSLQATPERSKVSRVSKNELEKASRLHREGKTRLPVPKRLAIAEQATAFAFQSRTPEEFTERCQKAGISVLWRKSQDGTLSGVSFASGEAKVSGTHAKLPLKRLLSILHHNEQQHPNHTPRRANTSVDRHSDRQGIRRPASSTGSQHASYRESGRAYPHPAQRGFPASAGHSRSDRSPDYPGRELAEYSRPQKEQLARVVTGTFVSATNALSGLLDELDDDLSRPTRRFPNPINPKLRNKL